MIGKNYISGSDWWNWRGKTESRVDAHDRELTELKRQEEALEHGVAERLEDLGQLLREVREAIVALQTRLEHLDQGLKRLDRRLGCCDSGFVDRKTRALIVGSGVAASGSAGAWLAYGLLQFGKTMGWW